jgi:hypothetical protein
MPYISVRITPEHCKVVDFSWDFEKSNSANMGCFWDMFTSSFLDDECRYLVAHEATNKFGEPCSQHYHINIHGKVSVQKETLQKWFNKHGAKGNKAYCIQVREDVEDEGRWWRYCCKEALLLHSGFSDEDLGRMVEMAVSERAHQVKTNVKTRDRLVNKNQFRDKLFKHLKDNHPNIRDEKKLIRLVGEYYQDQGKTPPFCKLEDVVLDYLIVVKSMSWEDFIERRYAHRSALLR